MSTCVRGGITYKRHNFVNEKCTNCGRAQFLDLDEDDSYEVVSNIVTDVSSVLDTADTNTANDVSSNQTPDTPFDGFDGGNTGGGGADGGW